MSLMGTEVMLVLCVFLCQVPQVSECFVLRSCSCGCVLDVTLQEHSMPVSGVFSE